MNCCVTCGRKLLSTPKATTLPERAELDRAYEARELSKDAYFDACKRIGLRDDLRFLIRVTHGRMPTNLQSEAQMLLMQLEQRASTANDRAAINSIRDRYRVSKGSLIIQAGSIEAMRRAAERGSREAA